MKSALHLAAVLFAFLAPPCFAASVPTVVAARPSAKQEAKAKKTLEKIKTKYIAVGRYKTARRKLRPQKG
jgi:hypothetical protein